MKFSPQEVPKLLFAGGQEDILGESSAYTWSLLCSCASVAGHCRGESCAGCAGCWLQPAPAH